jgi:hypothetical protein
LLCGMEQARRPALAHHVHRTAPMGPRVLINGIWYYAAIQAQSFHTPGYSETDFNGGDFALAYNSRTGTDTRSELGGRFDRVLALYTNAVLSLRARLA